MRNAAAVAANHSKLQPKKLLFLSHEASQIEIDEKAAVRGRNYESGLLTAMQLCGIAKHGLCTCAHIEKFRYPSHFISFRE